MDWTLVSDAETALTERGIAPDIIIVLGSGLGTITGSVVGHSIPYADLPGFVPTSVESHAGTLHVGTLAGASVAVLSGRQHMYEGHSAAQVALPVAALARTGATTLIVTNAAGGIAPDLTPGDLVLIDDHISLAGLSGADPMRGADNEATSARFTSLTEAYDEALLRVAEGAMTEMGLNTRRGVYAFASGPSFETPAEVRALRTLGADLVGMSTVPEVIAAKQAGLRVLGISLVTNRAQARRAPPDDHLAEIWALATNAAPVMGGLIERVAAAIGRERA